MASFSILNYQGSKKNLIDFIHKHTQGYVDENKAILDIFSGTCSVGYSYKKNYRVYANDSEYYSYIISKAMLGKVSDFCISTIKSKIESEYNANLVRLNIIYNNYILNENCYIVAKDEGGLVELYKSFPTIWETEKPIRPDKDIYNLFTTYYSGTYFGIVQSIQIDSVRYAISKICNDETLSAVLLSSLFYAIKECVFSKDGHMAQPLSIIKNSKKLFDVRQKSVIDYFYKKLDEFFSEVFVNADNGNLCFNKDFSEVIKNHSIRDDVGFIYADPPYTDMQYSRYYHLLNVVAKYDYPTPTIVRNSYTKGLYTENRFQSDLSKKSNCIELFSQLISFASCYKKNLAISFAYPKDVICQKTDRYVMSIDQIISRCELSFGKRNIKVEAMDYSHSNNRNSENKKVVEYLVLCKGVK